MTPRHVFAASAPPRELETSRAPDDRLSLRETIARAIYAERPFTIAQSGGVMEPLRAARTLDWDGAPDWYLGECFDLADAVAGRLLLAAGARHGRAGDGRGALGQSEMLAELRRRMAPWGASKRIAFACGTSVFALYRMRAGKQAISARVAEWLGYRRAVVWEPCDALREAVLGGWGQGAER